jgi:predicted HAD superfamily hydrolase
VSASTRLYTVDVFDTILLRGRESERRRMRWIAERVAEAIRLQGYARMAAEILNARIDAQAIAYGALRIAGDNGDVKLSHIHALQLLALGLPQSLQPLVTETEIAVDSGALSLNARLVRRLEGLRDAGARVVAVSDTYYSGEELRRLLRSHGAERAFDAVYASADFGATKKSGRLFPLVLEAEGVEPKDVLHLGDDRLADLDMPKAKGLAAQWAPRPWRVRLLRKVDALWQRARPLAPNWGSP